MEDENLLREVVGDDKNDRKRKVTITEEDGLDYEDEILTWHFFKFPLYYSCNQSKQWRLLQSSGKT